jgi:hypothetical protein
VLFSHRRAPSRKSRPVTADAIASIIAAWSPQPACPGVKTQPAAFAIDPGSTTDGAKNDHPRGHAFPPRARLS